jgi:hypothetical protein
VRGAFTGAPSRADGTAGAAAARPGTPSHTQSGQGEAWRRGVHEIKTAWNSRNLLRHNKNIVPANAGQLGTQTPDRPFAGPNGRQGRKSRMPTQPGIAFVTGGSRRLGRNTGLDLDDPPHERGDAARNRALLLDAARRLIAARGPDTVTMDEIAAAAGVGEGTLFRRFDSRAGLMIVLLDEDEQAEQQAFLFGPAPLGPNAPPL